MSESVSQGRHRAPGRYNPLSEFKVAMSRSAAPAVKSSAVLAASGGLVAAFAVPTSVSGASVASNGSAALAANVQPVRAPGSTTIAATSGGAALVSSTQSAATATTAKSSASGAAVTAPMASEKVTEPAVGVLAFTAVAKPKPKPVVVPAVETVSRSTSRAGTSSSSTASSSTDYSSAASRAAASGVIAVAQSLSGIYYRWGGTSPSTGFDCSGFTSYVFAKVGISLPRTAEAQRQAATRISNPQPGDLVFFGAPAYHVGIYAGGGMMYDSPTTGKTSGLHKIWSGNVSYGRP